VVGLLSVGCRLSVVGCQVVLRTKALSSRLRSTTGNPCRRRRRKISSPRLQAGEWSPPRERARVAGDRLHVQRHFREGFSAAPYAGSYRWGPLPPPEGGGYGSHAA